MSHAATYMYEFAWRSAQFGGRLGACHGLDVPFVFDTLGYGTEPLLRSDPPQQVANQMHAAWVVFATNGTAVGRNTISPQGNHALRWNIVDPRICTVSTPGFGRIAV